MKSNFMKALMAVTICLAMAIPDAKASDWSNGEFSCDLVVKELAPWYEVWNWGKWQSIDVKYSLISQPGSSFTYFCMSVFPGRVNFYCTGPHQIIDPTNKLDGSDKANEYTFNPGTTKAQVCEAVFKWQRIRKK